MGTPPAGAGDPGRARGRLGAIRLEVADANPEARTLYQGLGFRPGYGCPIITGPASMPTAWCWRWGMSGRRHHELRRLPGYGHQGAKLRRCPVCAAQTFLIGVVGWLVWWWCGADTSVNALTGLLFALGLGSLPAASGGVRMAKAGQTRHITC